MSELHINKKVCDLIAKRKIMAHDVILIRKEFAGIGLNMNIIANLIALETASEEKCPQWDAYFIHSICDYMLNCCGEPGQIDEDQFILIKSSITRNGLTSTQNEFEVLVHLLQNASSVPRSLCSLALDQICKMLYDGKKQPMVRNIHELDQPACDIVVALHKIIPIIQRTCIHGTLRAEGLLEMAEGKTRAMRMREGIDFLKPKARRLSRDRDKAINAIGM